MDHNVQGEKWRVKLRLLRKTQHRPRGPVQIVPSRLLEDLADDGTGSRVLLVVVLLVVLCSVPLGPLWVMPQDGPGHRCWKEFKVSLVLQTPERKVPTPCQVP